MSRLFVLILVLVCASGCLPRTTIRKDPGPHDKGIRYYRPKPYLMVKPMIAGDKPVEGYVTIEQVTLPDFSEEYSIHIRTGLGTNETAVTLTDGWNLTSINVKLDSQFDENLKAAAELAKAVPTGGIDTTETRMAVRATNVPMGLYEAVVSRGPDGKKRLYGFRYVGFMPYSSCPVESTGVECHDCYSSVLYGLVFEDGAMVFRALPDVPNHENLKRVEITAGAPVVEGQGPGELPAPDPNQPAF